MPATVPLATLRTTIRQRAEIENSTHITDARFLQTVVDAGVDDAAHRRWCNDWNREFFGEMDRLAVEAGLVSATPQPAAVAGMICAMPIAPAEDTAFGFQPDS